MHIPQPGAQLPTHRSRWARKLGALVLKLSGWEFVGELPDCPKLVMIGAPHTSNWDALYGFAALLATGLRISWLGKHTLFRWPLRKLIMALGGIPIERSARHGLVEQIVAEFERRDQLVLVLTPEGTRKRVEKWKTGFHAIARQAGAPILLGYLDYGNRRIGFGPAIELSGDMEKDMGRIEDFYRSITGKRPEMFNPSIRGQG